MSLHVAIAWEQNVCTLTLNRPATGNALSPELVAELEAGLDECAMRQPSLLVLRGEGRHFCTGFDLSRLDQETDDSLLTRFCRIELMLQKVHRAPFPTLAVATGRTMGAGADLFAACTHRLAAPGTQFAFPGAAGFGLVLGTRRLMHRVGAERAREWVSTAALISAEQAIATGLATGMMAGERVSDDFAIDEATGASIPPQEQRLASVLNAQDRVHDEVDLAHLVRSAAVPGLQARIAAYIQRNKQSPRS